MIKLDFVVIYRKQHTNLNFVMTITIIVKIPIQKQHHEATSKSDNTIEAKKVAWRRGRATKKINFSKNYQST
jgi:hypothetical protein